MTEAPHLLFLLLALALGHTSMFAQTADILNLGPGTVFRDCSDCPEMVVVPAGRFVPGDFTKQVLGIPGPSEETRATPDESAPIEAASDGITLPRPFAVGRYEITRSQFARFVEDSGYEVGKGCFAWNGGSYTTDPAKNWTNPGFEQTDNDPVICINWNDAKAYTRWLSEKTGRPYRLLTGPEWEYAARAGGNPDLPWREDTAAACRAANVADAAARRGVPGVAATWTFYDCDDGYAYTAPVGRYPPNAFGLYDMLGNVWEWTEECMNGGNESGTDASASPKECVQRVLRGGSWVDSPALIRYDFRFGIGPLDRDYYAGFRVARPQ